MHGITQLPLTCERKSHLLIITMLILVNIRTIFGVCGHVGGRDDRENLQGVDDGWQRRVGGGTEREVVPV